MGFDASSDHKGSRAETDDGPDHSGSDPGWGHFNPGRWGKEADELYPAPVSVEEALAEIEKAERSSAGIDGFSLNSFLQWGGRQISRFFGYVAPALKEAAQEWGSHLASPITAPVDAIAPGRPADTAVRDTIGDIADVVGDIATGNISRQRLGFDPSQDAKSWGRHTETSYGKREFEGARGLAEWWNSDNTWIDVFNNNKIIPSVSSRKKNHDKRKANPSPVSHHSGKKKARIPFESYRQYSRRSRVQHKPVIFR